MRYAQVDSGGRVVTFLDGKPEDWPDLVKANVLRRAAQNVRVGWEFDGVKFTEPPVQDPAPEFDLQVEIRRIVREEIASAVKERR